jgi:hypothetical protein
VLIAVFKKRFASPTSTSWIPRLHGYFYGAKEILICIPALVSIVGAEDEM